MAAKKTDTIKAQLTLTGEEAHLYGLLKNKKHFLESALTLIHKDENLRDIFFNKAEKNVFNTI